MAFPPLSPASPQQYGEENWKSKCEEKIVVQDKDVLINKVTKLKWYKDITQDLPQADPCPAILN